MPWGRLISSACAAAVIVVMAGCAGEHPGKKEPTLPLPPGVFEAPKGLKFSVKVTPSRFKLGEHVKLEATMFNDSSDRYTHTFPSACVWDYEVARDVRVVGPARTCAQAETDLTLEPGELRMIVREWGANPYFDATEPLAPGTYQVTAGLVEDGRVVPMADPVTVEVLPR
jgi:hypothetical protein